MNYIPRLIEMETFLYLISNTVLLESRASCVELDGSSMTPTQTISHLEVAVVSKWVTVKANSDGGVSGGVTGIIII